MAALLQHAGEGGHGGAADANQVNVGLWVLGVGHWGEFIATVEVIRLRSKPFLIFDS
jgi:hypothetical protein